MRKTVKEVLEEWESVKATRQYMQNRDIQEVLEAGERRAKLMNGAFVIDEEKFQIYLDAYYNETEGNKE